MIIESIELLQFLKGKKKKVVKKLKVLITGIGITGKSLFRRLVVNISRPLGLTVEHYDADRFEELRDPDDTDCLKDLPDSFKEDRVYIIEDIHALLSSAVLPLENYDLILYIKPDIFSHFMFWLKRMGIWFRTGRFSWEAENGWQGTDKAYDLRNIIPILRTAFYNFSNRKKWISEDLKTISSFPYIIIYSRWIFKGIKFARENASSLKKD